MNENNITTVLTLCLIMATAALVLTAHLKGYREGYRAGRKAERKARAAERMQEHNDLLLNEQRVKELAIEAVEEKFDEAQREWGKQVLGEDATDEEIRARAVFGMPRAAG